MVTLLGVVAVPFMADLLLVRPKESIEPVSGRAVRLIRRVSEDEVIAGFLKSDFRSPEFREYQESMGDLVTILILTMRATIQNDVRCYSSTPFFVEADSSRDEMV